MDLVLTIMEPNLILYRFSESLAIVTHQKARWNFIGCFFFIFFYSYYPQIYFLKKKNINHSRASSFFTTTNITRPNNKLLKFLNYILKKQLFFIIISLFIRWTLSYQVNMFIRNITWKYKFIKKNNHKITNNYDIHFLALFVLLLAFFFIIY